MEIHFQDVPAHRCHYARHDRLQHGRYGVRRANRHRGTGRRRFARVAVLFIADDVRHMDRRWRLHRDFDSARRKRHRKSQIRKRRMCAFKPCFRRPARRRRAPFPECVSALFRRRCRHMGLHRAVPSDSGTRHARGGLFQCIRKPCPRRRCRADCRHAQYARHRHQHRLRPAFHLRPSPRRAGCRHRNGSRQCFNRARPAFLSPPPRYHLDAQHAQSIPHAACLP